MNFKRPEVAAGAGGEAPTQTPTVRLVCSGDIVILYERHDSLNSTTIEKGGITRNRFGGFKHDDIIGKPYGYKARSFDRDCFCYILEPTPELWSNAAKTRTQIVNEMDQSVVTFMLNVKPGNIVVESGTGSACMSLSLARAIYHPTNPGHVFTYEFNPFRATEAQKEMNMMGLEKVITVQCHDVCARYDGEGGGGFPGVKENQADAVFLGKSKSKSKSYSEIEGSVYFSILVYWWCLFSCGVVH